jgi:GTPase SAR1 family protein
MIALNRQVVKLQMWDAGGDDKFRSITSFYYRSTSWFYLCFDAYNSWSFEHLDRWWNELINVHKISPSIITLVANKCDSSNNSTAMRVSTEQAQTWAKQRSEFFGAKGERQKVAYVVVVVATVQTSTTWNAHHSAVSMLNISFYLPFAH